MYERRHPDAPWLTVDAVAFLERWLEPQHEGFEWGSGRSTVWFARRVRHLTSIEHNPVWHDRVVQSLSDQQVSSRVRYRCICVEESAAKSDHEYVQAIAEIPDGFLDFCLVDGVASLRAACALACLPKIRPGGIVIVDNANWFLPRNPPSRAPNSRGPDDGHARADWAEFDQRVTDWHCTWTTNGVFDTALWTKPA